MTISHPASVAIRAASTLRHHTAGTKITACPLPYHKGLCQSLGTFDKAGICIFIRVVGIKSVDIRHENELRSALTRAATTRRKGVSLSPNSISSVDTVSFSLTIGNHAQRQKPVEGVSVR